MTYRRVQTTIALNYHISPDKANIIYQQAGDDYADRIIAPTIQESVKASVAKFNAEELNNKKSYCKGCDSRNYCQYTISKEYSCRDSIHN